MFLKNLFGVTGFCLSWFDSYLSSRSFCVSIESSQFSAVSFDFGVPHGSILGTLLYILYTSELPKIISSFSVNSQLYADDFYIYSTCTDSSLDFIFNNIKSCLTTIISWSSSMRLKLNISKSELIYFDKSSKYFSFPNLVLPSPAPLSLLPSSSLHSLGFVFDSNLYLIPQILSVTRYCFFHLRRIRLLPYLDDPSPTFGLLSSTFPNRLLQLSFLWFNGYIFKSSI